MQDYFISIFCKTEIPDTKNRQKQLRFFRIRVDSLWFGGQAIYLISDGIIALLRHLCKSKEFNNLDFLSW